ncbi:hypothetical protein GE09DRAFT_58926 [Coniochaeta sp. 2T2.1]|nr:hypothetical protein GE09DRAFT_58926 [Coniochaeta sp. 2T2.1]
MQSLKEWRGRRLAGKAAVALGRAFCYGQRVFQPSRPRPYSTDRPAKTTSCDVCIIGGGASGTFAAVRLLDSKKTVALVEQGSRLGGHTITYRDPMTSQTAEAGVVVIRESQVSRRFFDRFDITLTKFNPPPPAAEVSVDFTTGKQINTTAAGFPAQSLAAYGQQVARYPYLDDGFDLPLPLEEDLAMPFGHFVKKYDLSPMVPLAWKLCQGFGDLLAQPTLYVMKNFGKTALEGFQNGFLVPDGLPNDKIYEVALSELDSSADVDVKLRTSVVSATRSGRDGVTVRVRSEAGHVSVIKTEKLLITIPPTVENLAAFDLDVREKSLFTRFHHKAWWTLILRNTGIRDGYCLANLRPGNRESLPTLPGIYEITPTGIHDTVNLKYGSPRSLSEDEVRADVLASLARLRRVSPDLFSSSEDKVPEVALFANHDPFGLTASVSAINDGVYKKLHALNGHRNTFYTGAAFQAHDCSLLWEYTDRVLKRFF